MSGLVAGKVAMVTGSGSGIGRASALKFAAEGAKVVVSDVNVDGGNETVELIKKAGGEATFIKCDVSKATEVEALIKGVVDAYGRLDCAYNNAGIEGDAATTINCSEENFDLNYQINLKGVWLCMKYEILQFLAQGDGGAIVSTASVAGLVGVKGSPAYVAAKHGVVGLTKTAALEFAKKDIRVNAVCPGVIETPMVGRLTGGSEDGIARVAKWQPVGRMGQPDEIAATAVWLCSDQASFVTGHAMPVDGGIMAA
jgi:NAD(P)-dependent dehydrogenase (short-subunit alcohol dehydrogenase family)